MEVERNNCMEIRGRRKPKVNHRNTEQHIFSHSVAYNKYLLNSLEYYAIENVFLWLIVLKTLFHVTKYIAKLNMTYKNNINLIFLAP